MANTNPFSDIIVTIDWFNLLVRTLPQNILHLLGVRIVVQMVVDLKQTLQKHHGQLHRLFQAMIGIEKADSLMKQLTICKRIASSILSRAMKMIGYQKLMIRWLNLD